MDYSKIFHSVSASKRTDKFKTVSALYCLGAAENPVTTKQISELLKLHLRSKKPKNISDILSKYSSLITVVQGQPLRWKLMEEGVSYLQSLTKLELSISTTISDYASDIGVICALEFPEFEAVINATGGTGKWKEISDPRYPHIYRESEITTKEGKKLRVIGVTSTSMGLTAAAIATTQLAMQFRPRIIAMIGIAAGTSDGKKSFGDILIADPSVDYASGKISSEDGVRGFQPDPYPLGLNARLRMVLQKYRGEHELFSKILNKWTDKKPGSMIRMHIGPLGAADQVIDDPSRIVEIKMNWRKLIGIEMETYAVYRASHESPEPKPRFVSFKSVCDFAALKTDSWQKYAAFTAAEFAFRFFENEWAALWPKEIKIKE